LQSVTKRFDDITVCDQIDLQIDTGEMLCLIGASGSGKSTLLRCLNLLEPIDDGRIWLDDTEISVPGLDPGPVRKRVGIVFQSFNLFPHMTVMDNITLAPKRVLSQDKTHAEDHAQQLLAQFGLGDKAREYPDRLSGGQQQRVAIVRAMAMNPEVMLLDEITSALDPELVGEVLDVVRALKSQGMTIVLATHEMSFARDVADRVCFLDQGRVVEIAPPAVMFTNPVQQRTQQFLQRVLQQ
jgi:polar amino acid transport system ATP-binding protein